MQAELIWEGFLNYLKALQLVLQKHFIEIKYQKVTTSILELFFNTIIYKYILDYSNLKDMSTCSLPSKMRKILQAVFKVWTKTNPLDCF